MVFDVFFYRFLLNSHTHSPLARAMYNTIKIARLNDKFQDPLYLFLELVRAGVMHGHLWSGRAFSGGPSFGTGTFCHPPIVMGLSWSTVSDRVLFFSSCRRREKMYVIGHAGSQHRSLEL